MTTPRKRPSVKNKKTARPASRHVPAAPGQGAAFGDAAQEGTFASPAGASSPFPSVPPAAEPPQPNIPFAAPAPQAGGGQGAQFGGGLAAQAENNGPADFFDLGDDLRASAAPSGGAGRGRKSVSSTGARRTMRSRTQKTTDRNAESGGASASEESVRGGRTNVSRKPTRTTVSRNKTAAERPKARGVGRIIAIIVAVVAIAALAVGAFFVWNTFLRYDDAADIQGEWRTQEGTMTVVIDATNIRMPELEYSYEIDKGAKTITFHFSDLTGSGTYSFSEDRSTLTIVEGEGDTAATTVLVRVSNNTQATPQLLEEGLAEGESADAAASGSDAAGGDASAGGAGDGSSAETGEDAAGNDATDGVAADSGAAGSDSDADAAATDGNEA